MLDERKAAVQLHILIVGAGIGGLSAAYCLAQAGHKITVVEKARELKGIGAGIQLTPNSTRLLIRWGLGKRLEEVAGFDRCKVKPLFRYTGSLLLMQTHGKDFEHESGGAPTYQMLASAFVDITINNLTVGTQRADLQKMLYELASPYMDLRLGSEVCFVDPSTSTVSLKSGETLSGDLIIGADGVRSVVREALGNPQQLEPMHESVYRYLIPAEEMLMDLDLRPFMETPSLTTWLGPRKNVVGYGIKDRSLYYMAVHVPEIDSQVQDVHTTNGDPVQMRAAFSESCEDWDHRVLKLLALAKSNRLLKSRMLHCRPLDTWVHPLGHVTLLGDACHAFPPYYGQGSALAIEDAAVMGNLFSRISDRSQIKFLLQAYEEIRRPRASATWLDTMEREVWLHHADGPEQQTRDIGMKDFRILKHRREHEATIPIYGLDAYGYDADEVVDIWWKENGGSIVSC